MNTFRKILPLVLLLVVGAFVLPAKALALDADAGKRHVTALIDEALHSFDGKMSREEKSATLKRLIGKYGDVRTSAQDVLGRYWSRVTPEQQEKFTALLLDYAIGSWVDEFGDMPAEQRIDFVAVEPQANGRTLFRSVAVNAQQSTPVDWILAEGGDGRLAIVDVAVEGVSIIKAMGSDFTAIIRANGGKIDPLFEAMEGKIAAYQAGTARK